VHARLGLPRGEALVCLVLRERPRHADSNLLGTRVNAVALNARDSASIAITGLRSNDRCLPKAECRKVLLAPLTERLTLLRRIDLGESHRECHLAIGRFAPRGERITISDADNNAEQDFEHRPDRRLCGDQAHSPFRGSPFPIVISYDALHCTSCDCAGVKGAPASAVRTVNTRRTVVNRLFVALIVGLVLTGCASAPERRYWPLLPKDSSAAKPFAPPLSTAGSEMEDIRNGLTTMREKIAELSNDAGAHDWSSGDVTTVGGLMAVVGQIAEKVGLRNTGLGLAALTYTGRERFQFSAQRTAFLNASDALTCLQQVINHLTDREREIALALGQPPEAKAATNAPLAAVQAVEFARAKLERDLTAVSAAPADRAALVDFVKRYAEESKPADAPTGPKALTRNVPFTAKNAKDGSVVPEWKVQEALNKAKGFESELRKCRHE
jgi:hypothetical protein